MDGVMRQVWKDQKRRSGIVLQQCLAWARKLPPVQKRAVRGMLYGPSGQPFPRQQGMGRDTKDEEANMVVASEEDN